MLPVLMHPGEELGNEAFATVTLALGPALALAAGLHEADDLFVINDGVVGPAGADASRRTFMENSISFRQAVTAPAVLADDFRGDAHAVPPRAVDKPMLYLAKCHMWLMSQKAMEKVPAIHESVDS